MHGQINTAGINAAHSDIDNTAARDVGMGAANGDTAGERIRALGGAMLTELRALDASKTTIAAVKTATVKAAVTADKAEG